MKQWVPTPGDGSRPRYVEIAEAIKADIDRGCWHRVTGCRHSAVLPKKWDWMYLRFQEDMQKLSAGDMSKAMLGAAHLSANSRLPPQPGLIRAGVRMKTR